MSKTIKFIRLFLKLRLGIVATLSIQITYPLLRFIFSSKDRTQKAKRTFIFTQIQTLKAWTHPDGSDRKGGDYGMLYLSSINMLLFAKNIPQRRAHIWVKYWSKKLVFSLEKSRTPLKYSEFYSRHITASAILIWAANFVRDDKEYIFALADQILNQIDMRRAQAEVGDCGAGKDVLSLSLHLSKFNLDILYVSQIKTEDHLKNISNILYAIEYNIDLHRKKINKNHFWKPIRSLLKYEIISAQYILRPVAAIKIDIFKILLRLMRDHEISSVSKNKISIHIQKLMPDIEKEVKCSISNKEIYACYLHFRYICAYLSLISLEETTKTPVEVSDAISNAKYSLDKIISNKLVKKQHENVRKRLDFEKNEVMFFAYRKLYFLDPEHEDALEMAVQHAVDAYTAGRGIIFESLFLRFCFHALPLLALSIRNIKDETDRKRRIEYTAEFFGRIYTLYPIQASFKLWCSIIESLANGAFHAPKAISPTVRGIELFDYASIEILSTGSSLARLDKIRVLSRLGNLSALIATREGNPLQSLRFIEKARGFRWREHRDIQQALHKDESGHIGTLIAELEQQRRLEKARFADTGLEILDYYSGFETSHINLGAKPQIAQIRKEKEILKNTAPHIIKFGKYLRENLEKLIG